jgi:ribosomal protein S18
MPPRMKKRDDMYRDRRRRKVCSFCADKTVVIDYKEVNRLRRYLSERAKIEPRRKTGTCACRSRSSARDTWRCSRTLRSTSAPDAVTARVAGHRGAAAQPAPLR